MSLEQRLNQLEQLKQDEHSLNYILEYIIRAKLGDIDLPQSIIDALKEKARILRDSIVTRLSALPL